ncbi:MAG TPA: type Z 30S ribosomal protein S14 [bacterium]
MAKKSALIRNERRKEHSTRYKNRCKVCGRARAYIRRFGLCRICFRQLFHEGVIPGVRKASW